MSGLAISGTSQVVVPVATAEALGVMQVGANLTVDENGVVSALAPTPEYVLAPATTSVLGGVIVGSNLTVDENGALSAPAPAPAFVLEPATTTTLGGVIVGSGLEANSSGVLSVIPQTPIDVAQVYTYVPPTPTANNQTFTINLVAPTGCHVILPMHASAGYQNITVNVVFATPTQDGAAFELVLTPTSTNGLSVNYEPLANAGASMFPTLGPATQTAKLRWVQETSTWYVMNRVTPSD